MQERGKKFIILELAPSIYENVSQVRLIGVDVRIIVTLYSVRKEYEKRLRYFQEHPLSVRDGGIQRHAMYIYSFAYFPIESA